MAMDLDLEMEMKRRLDDARRLLLELDVASIDLKAQLDEIQRAHQDGDSGNAVADAAGLKDSVQDMGKGFLSMGHALLDVARLLSPEGGER